MIFSKALRAPEEIMRHLHPEVDSELSVDMVTGTPEEQGVIQDAMEQFMARMMISNFAFEDFAIAHVILGGGESELFDSPFISLTANPAIARRYAESPPRPGYKVAEITTKRAKRHPQADSLVNEHLVPLVLFEEEITAVNPSSMYPKLQFPF